MVRTRQNIVRKPIASQITNRNFLAPSGFKFTISKAPKVTFFGNMVNVPGLTLGVAQQPSYLKNIPRPGEIIEFDDLTLRFLVDENLENYLEIQNWIRGLGFPESLGEIYDFQEQDNVGNLNNKELNLDSDGTLTILNNINNPVFHVNFEGLFPYSLTTLNFDATQTDIEYFTAEVNFKYTIYNITTA